MKSPVLLTPAAAVPPRGKTCRSISLFARLREQSGQTLIEMALVLPIFFTVAFGMIQYSILYFTYLNANYACRSAARSASLCSNSSLSPCSTTQIKSIVTSSVFLNRLITPTVNVNYFTQAFGTGTNTVGNIVEVSVTWNQSVPIPFMTTNSVSVTAWAYRMVTR